MSNVRADARMALARYESSVAAFGMEAGFPMKDVRAVQEYIEKLEAALQRANANVEEYERKFYLGADRIEKLEAALRGIIGALDDPNGGQHVYDMRNASYIARKALMEKKDG